MRGRHWGVFLCMFVYEEWFESKATRTTTNQSIAKSHVPPGTSALAQDLPSRPLMWRETIGFVDSSGESGYELMPLLLQQHQFPLAGCHLSTPYEPLKSGDWLEANHHEAILLRHQYTPRKVNSRRVYSITAPKHVCVAVQRYLWIARLLREWHM